MEKVIVIVENEYDLKMYCLLFHKMLGKDQINLIKVDRENARIQTSNHYILFVIKNASARAYRADYVINLTQDIDFENNYAIPMTVIRKFSY